MHQCRVTKKHRIRVVLGEPAQCQDYISGFTVILRDAALMQANALLSTNSFEEAVDVLENVRKPIRADIELGIGKAYAGNGETAKALDAFHKIYYQIPLCSEADEAGARLRELAPNDAYVTRAVRKTRADLLAKGKWYSQAIAEYQKLVTEGGADASASVQVALANAQYKSGHVAETRTLLSGLAIPENEIEANAQRFFLLAEIADWEKLNLLPGEANIIFEGTYIGKSFIDPSSTQDTLNLTMGRDKRVVVKKEKLVDYSSIKFLGANKKQIFTYEITVKNNKKDAIEILVKDQYPISQDKEVDVELLESSEAANNNETGVLTWKLKLAPGEVKKLKISYSVKYPKDKTLNLN